MKHPQIILLGRVGNTPTTKHTTQGRLCTMFHVSTRDGERVFQVRAWDVSPAPQVGERVYVEGDIHGTRVTASVVKSLGAL